MTSLRTFIGIYFTRYFHKTLSFWDRSQDIRESHGRSNGMRCLKGSLTWLSRLRVPLLTKAQIQLIFFAICLKSFIEIRQSTQEWRHFYQGYENLTSTRYFQWLHQARAIRSVVLSTLYARACVSTWWKTSFPWTTTSQCHMTQRHDQAQPESRLSCHSENCFFLIEILTEGTFWLSS